MRSLAPVMLTAILSGCIGAGIGHVVPASASATVKPADTTTGLAPNSPLCTDANGVITTNCDHLAYSNVTLIGQTSFEGQEYYAGPNGYWIMQVAGDNAIAWWYNNGVDPTNYEKFSWHNDGGFYSGYLWLPAQQGETTPLPANACVDTRRVLHAC